MYVQLVNGDLLAQDVDAVVHAWNRNWLPWWLVWMNEDSAALRSAAGDEPFRELGRVRSLRSGDAVSTTAGNLTCKRIIHVAAAGWFGGPLEPTIAKAIRSTLEITQAEQLRSVAFPVLGGGLSGLSQQEALDVMLREFQDLDYGVNVCIVMQELLATQS